MAKKYRVGQDGEEQEELGHWCPKAGLRPTNRLTRASSCVDVLIRSPGQRKCHPYGDVTLNRQEPKDSCVLDQLPIAQAAEIMGVSERHISSRLTARSSCRIGPREPGPPAPHYP